MPPSRHVQALIHAWSASGGIRPGATVAEIETFESRYGVRLPPDFRAYLLAVNGMHPNQTDRHCTHFWGLDRIQPAAAYHPSAKHPFSDVEAARYFIFCDILIDAFWYAIRLSSEPDVPSPVCMWADGGVKIVARSFTEFTEEHVGDPGVLLMEFPPRP